MTQSLDTIYTPENVPICEAIYGEGLISLGGYEAVDQMMRGLELCDKQLLDIGSGIGGIPIYLSETYGCYVTGLDIYPWMAEYSTKKVKSSLSEKVRFVTAIPGESFPVESESMDLVYSKGVLTNIQDKPTLFKDIYRVLKPGGEICLIDWVLPETIGPSTQCLTTGEKSYKETLSSYKDLLHQAGFNQIEMEDVSDEYLAYVRNLHNLLSSSEHKLQFANIIGDELRDMLLKANRELLAEISEGRQFSMRIRAKKAERN